MIYEIYMISTSDGNYIGCTRIGTENRIRKHIANAKSAKSTLLYESLANNNFVYTFRTLESVEVDSRIEAEKVEHKWIETYDTYKNGLNMTIGGMGGAICKQLTGDRLDNYLKHLSDRNSGLNNATACKITNEELIQLGIECYKKLGNLQVKTYYNFCNSKNVKVPAFTSKFRFGRSYVNFVKIVCEHIDIAYNKNIHAYVKTEEHKEAISKSISGKSWFTNGSINKQINGNQIDHYMSIGFTKGRTIKTQINA